MNRQQLIAELDGLIARCKPNAPETAVLLTLRGALESGREVGLMRLVVDEFVEPELAMMERARTAHMN